MVFFGRRAMRKAEDLDKKVELLKAQNTKKINKATDSSTRLHNLLKANGITLRIYVATGGDNRHG